MGNNPSRQLYHAARRGDVPGMVAARAEGGDVNWRNEGKFQQTPLIAAAKHNRTEAVQWLLVNGALDYRSSMGETALAVAAKMGHHQCCAVLLDRGSDAFSRNGDGQRPIEQAAVNGHTAVVRLIEARVCPFVGQLETEKSGWFANYFTHSWVSVSRARPWDNPTIDRRDVRMSIYRDTHAAQPEVELLRPAVLPVRVEVVAGQGEVVDFTLNPEATLVRGKPVANKPVKARLPRAQFNWLMAVLSDSFGTGRGPAYDPATGLVKKSEWGYTYEAQFNTLAWTQSRGAPPVKVPPYRAEDSVGGLMGPGQAGAGMGVGAGVAQVPMRVVPAAALISAATQAQMPPVNHVRGAVPVALPAPSAPPAVDYAPQGLPASRAGAATAGVAGAAAQARPAAAALVAQPAPRAAAAQPAATGGRAGAGASASSTPSYWTPALEALNREVQDGSVSFDEEPPESFVCPITADICVDPVVAADGHTYGRQGIVEWLSLKQTSPKTNEPMTSDVLFPNHLLRGEILAWVERHRVKVGAPAPAAAAAVAAPAGQADLYAYSTYPVAAARPVDVAGPVSPLSGQRAGAGVGAGIGAGVASGQGYGYGAGAGAAAGSLVLDDDELRAGHGSRSLSGGQQGAAALGGQHSQGLAGAGAGQRMGCEPVPLSAVMAGQGAAAAAFNGEQAPDTSAWPQVPRGVPQGQGQAAAQPGARVAMLG